MINIKIDIDQEHLIHDEHQFTVGYYQKQVKFMGIPLYTRRENYKHVPKEEDKKKKSVGYGNITT